MTDETPLGETFIRVRLDVDDVQEDVARATAATSQDGAQVFGTVSFESPDFSQPEAPDLPGDEPKAPKPEQNDSAKPREPDAPSGGDERRKDELPGGPSSRPKQPDVPGMNVIDAGRTVIDKVSKPGTLGAEVADLAVRTAQDKARVVPGVGAVAAAGIGIAAFGTLKRPDIASGLLSAVRGAGGEDLPPEVLAAIEGAQTALREVAALRAKLDAADAVVSDLKAVAISQAVLFGQVDEGTLAELGELRFRLAEFRATKKRVKEQIEADLVGDVTGKFMRKTVSDMPEVLDRVMGGM